MITKVEDISEDDFEPFLKVTCKYDDSEVCISNVYVVRENEVMVRNKSTRKITVNLVSLAQNVGFTDKGDVNAYVKNDIADCVRVFNSIFHEGKWVSP